MPFYTQHNEVAGITVEASAGVSPYALAEAAWLVSRVVPANDARTLSSSGVRLVVLGATEMVTDLPEYADLSPAIWWNRRYRGMGPTEEIPIILCPEEDLLRRAGAPEDRGTSICLHELTHAVERAHALRRDDFGRRIHAAYERAAGRALWPDSYEMATAGEYFVLGAGIWFGTPPPIAVAAGVTTRDRLRRHDAGLAKVCEAAFGTGTWRYAEPELRARPDRGHLSGFDPSAVLPFSWPERARWDTPALMLTWASSPPPRSPPGGDAGWLILANHRHEPVEVEWLDQDGVPRPWFALRSGEERIQDVYDGHVWIFRAASGELGSIVVRSGVQFFEVSSRPLIADGPALRASIQGEDALLSWDASPATASPPSDDRVWILFANRRSDEVVIDWLDFHGRWQAMDTIPAGDELLRDAFIGHVWRVRQGDRSLGHITIGRGHARVDVG